MRNTFYVLISVSLSRDRSFRSAPKIGHDLAKRAVTIDRNHRSRLSEMTGHDAPKYAATLNTTKPLRLLNLTALPKEEVTEFESLDISVNMLFLASKHSYEIARHIAVRARDEGFDGLIYPSYFSELRTGVMPLRTTYGLSNRRIPQYQKIEEALAVPNYAIFGRPIEDGRIVVNCINKMVISRVEYGFHFGPVGI